MKKFIKILAALLFLFPSITSAQYLPATQIPFGTGTYFASSSPNFVYSTTTNRLTVTGNINVTGTASTSILCLTSDTCRSTWPTGGSGTVTSVDMTVPTGLTISGNPITTLGTLALSLTSGFNIPLTASTTQWNNLYNASTTLFSAGTGLTLTGTAFSVNTSQNISTLSNLTSNGFVKTSSGTGALSIDTASYQTLDPTLTALAAYNTNGILTQTAADTFTGRTITGTTNRLDVTNGNGVSGNPTLDISSTYVGQTSLTTLGTITTGTWNAAGLTSSGLLTVNGAGDSYFAGDVGVGTTSPYARLSVNGAPGGTQDVFAIATSTSGFATTSIVRVASNGEVIFGQTGKDSGMLKFESLSGAAFFGKIGHGNDPGDGPYVGITSNNIDVRFTSGARSFWTASGGSRDTGIFMNTSSVFTAAAAKMLYLKNQSQSSSGDAASLYIEPFWNTSGGTANTSDILITRTDTSLCATCKNDFARFQIGSTDKFRVFNDGGGYYAGKLGMGTTTPNATSYTFGSIGRAPRNCSIGCTINATADAEIRVTNTSAPRTITLPTCDGSTLGNEYGVKDSSGGAATNNITVARAGSDTIDGATSKVISTNYGYFRFYCGIAGAWDIH